MLSLNICMSIVERGLLCLEIDESRFPCLTRVHIQLTGDFHAYLLIEELPFFVKVFGWIGNVTHLCVIATMEQTCGPQ